MLPAPLSRDIDRALDRCAPIGLAAACLLFVLYAATFLNLQHPMMPLGPASDDDFRAGAAIALLHGLPKAVGVSYLDLGRLQLPYLCGYHGAWGVYLAAPFASWQSSPHALALANSVYCVLALLANLFAVKRLFRSLPLAVFSTAVIALHPAFIQWCNLSYAASGYHILFVVGAFYSACRWYLTRSRYLLFLAAFLLGFGCSLNLRLSYAAFAFLAVMILNFRHLYANIWKRKAKPCVRDLLVSGLCFCLGNLWITCALLSSLGESAGILSLFKNLTYAPYSRLPNLYWLTGSNAWVSVLLGGSLLWLLAAPSLSKRNEPEAKLGVFAAELVIFYVAASPFSISSYWGADHILELIPIASWMLCFFLQDAARRFKLGEFRITLAVLALIGAQLSMSFRHGLGNLYGFIPASLGSAGNPCRDTLLPEGRNDGSLRVHSPHRGRAGLSLPRENSPTHKSQSLGVAQGRRHPNSPISARFGSALRIPTGRPRFLPETPAERITPFRTAKRPSWVIVRPE